MSSKSAGHGTFLGKLGPAFHVNLHQHTRKRHAGADRLDARGKLRHVISGHAFQIAVLLLILADLALVVTGLVLESFYPEYEFITVECHEVAESGHTEGGASTAHEGRKLLWHSESSREPWQAATRDAAAGGFEGDAWQQAAYVRSLRQAGRTLMSEELPELHDLPPAPPVLPGLQQVYSRPGQPRSA